MGRRATQTQAGNHPSATNILSRPYAHQSRVTHSIHSAAPSEPATTWSTWPSLASSSLPLLDVFRHPPLLNSDQSCHPISNMRRVLFRLAREPACFFRICAATLSGYVPVHVAQPFSEHCLHLRLSTAHSGSRAAWWHSQLQFLISLRPRANRTRTARQQGYRANVGPGQTQRRFNSMRPRQHRLPVTDAHPQQHTRRSISI